MIVELVTSRLQDEFIELLNAKLKDDWNLEGGLIVTPVCNYTGTMGANVIYSQLVSRYDD